MTAMSRQRTCFEATGTDYGFEQLLIPAWLTDVPTALRYHLDHVTSRLSPLSQLIDLLLKTMTSSRQTSEQRREHAALGMPAG